MMKVKSGVYNGVLCVVSISIFVVAAEISLRLFHWVNDGIPLFERPGQNVGNLSPFTIDDRLGWRATENYHRVSQTRTFKGDAYTVRLSQNQYGFRMFGDVRSRKTRVLVLGDSYTHAWDVSDDETYYGIVRDALGVEVFAYGLGGAGTLQEFMILDRYIDVVNPHFILWQYCSNDLINNSPELEAASSLNNNSMIRPYLVDGEVRYLLPKNHFAMVREVAFRYSRFLAAVLHRVDKLQAANTDHTVEDDIVKTGFQHEGFLQAVRVTDTIMGMVRARAGSIPIVAFNCMGSEPFDEAFRQISKRHGIRFYSDVGRSIQALKNNGGDVRAEDGVHWNSRGHRVVGDLLAKHLGEDGLGLVH